MQKSFASGIIQNIPKEAFTPNPTAFETFKAFVKDSISLNLLSAAAFGALGYWGIPKIWDADNPSLWKDKRCLAGLSAVAGSRSPNSLHP